MKIKDLIKELSKYDPETMVIMSSDGEGNGNSPLSSIEGNCVYEADTTYSGSVYDKEWSADDACKDDEEWEGLKKSTPDCVVLWPIN